MTNTTILFAIVISFITSSILFLSTPVTTAPISGSSHRDPQNYCLLCRSTTGNPNTGESSTMSGDPKGGGAAHPPPSFAIDLKGRVAPPPPSSPADRAAPHAPLSLAPPPPPLSATCQLCCKNQSRIIKKGGSNVWARVTGVIAFVISGLMILYFVGMMVFNLIWPLTFDEYMKFLDTKRNRMDQIADVWNVKKAVIHGSVMCKLGVVALLAVLVILKLG